MNRIAVIGCGGSGKSTLSLALGNSLSIPVHHLDCMFWEPGWISIERKEFVHKQEVLFEQNQWIIDGNYGGTMDLRLEKADTIIFLDLPTIICLWGVLSRYFNYINDNRPDMAEGNGERVTLEFLIYVWTYRKQRKPNILAKLVNMVKTKEVIILQSRTAICQFLQESKNKKIQANVLGRN